MSNEQSLTESGSKEESQEEISCSESQAEDSKLLLTVENVQKLQDDNPDAKSAIAKQSIEAFIEQSNLFLNESETNANGGQEQKLPEEKETSSIILYREGFQTSSLPSSAFEAQSSKKHDVEDLGTQTEWSYSDGSDVSVKQKKKKLSQKSSVGKEKRHTHRVPSEAATIGSIGKEEQVEIELDSKESSPDEEPEITTLFSQEDHSITNLCRLGCCEFCNDSLHALPTAEELEERPDTMESFICCRTYKDVFRSVIQELLENNTSGSEIDIRPHRHLSQALLESKTKKCLMDEIQERGFENYREVFEQYMRFGPCIKIKFQLSNYPPKPKKVAVKKQRPNPKDLLMIDTEFKAEQLKICHPLQTVTRYYADGKIFFFMFPDGSGQVYYPSGNVAILITYGKDIQFTYFVLSDSSPYTVQAFFTNQGYAACYYPSGTIQVALDLCTGSFFNKKRIRKKYWNWWDDSSHVHAPPFRSLCLQLNVYIEVKIEAQDRIFLTFTNLHHCLQLNVGSRLKLKDPKMLEFLKEAETTDGTIVKIAELLTNVKKLLKKLCAAPPEKTKGLSLIIESLCDQMHRWQNQEIEKKQRKWK